MRQEHLEAYLKAKEDMVRRARRVAEYGFSYRDFRVGSAILAYRPKGPGLTERYKVFTAANAKPVPGIEKWCAEATAVLFSRCNGYTEIVAIVTAGEPQVDQGSDILSETLHPCEHCRALFKAIPEVLDDTIILTVSNHDESKREEHTFAEIIRIHEPA